MSLISSKDYTIKKRDYNFCSYCGKLKTVKVIVSTNQRFKICLDCENKLGGVKVYGRKVIPPNRWIDCYV